MARTGTATPPILLSGEGVEAIVPRHGVPQNVPVVETNGMLVPGFVDLQVNGGGGVMLNGRQDVESIRTICAAHAAFGTTALLPTLITDTPEITARAVDAGAAAAQAPACRVSSGCIWRGRICRLPARVRTTPA